MIEQWDLGSEFFVILDGTASVSVDGKPARELGPGDFFGELRGARVGRRLRVSAARFGARDLARCGCSSSRRAA